LLGLFFDPEGGDDIFLRNIAAVRNSQLPYQIIFPHRIDAKTVITENILHTLHFYLYA
jgi:hypothetical protein